MRDANGVGQRVHCVVAGNHSMRTHSQKARKCSDSVQRSCAKEVVMVPQSHSTTRSLAKRVRLRLATPPFPRARSDTVATGCQIQVVHKEFARYIILMHLMSEVCTPNNRAIVISRGSPLFSAQPARSARAQRNDRPLAKLWIQITLEP